MSTLEIDILDPAIYERGVPHEVYARLRREAPVYFHREPDGGPGFWAVTRYRDVREVSRDATTFSSEVAGTQIPNLPPGDLRGSPDNLANMDPPRHTQFRAIINQAFTPQGLKQVEGFIRTMVDASIGEMLEKRSFDFMAEIAHKLPMATILRMVGVPPADDHKIAKMVSAILVPEDPDHDKKVEVWKSFVAYAHEVAADRKGTPRDDLLSRLMTAGLAPDEFAMFFILLLAAGTHTTSLSLGAGMLSLIENPEARAKVLAEPAKMAGAVDEILRCHPPLLHFRRTATRDTEIRNQPIKKGDKVVLWYAAANRDEEVFTDPDRFDIERTPNEHLAFGYGPHFCLGQALGRMQLEIALGECLRRLPGLRVDGPIERIRSNWFNGMKRLPVRCGDA